MYLFELPTTGAISFGDILIDNSNAYTARIADATGARANVRAALKESKRTDGEKDHLRLVKVLDDYLPYLYSIVNCLATDELTLRTEPIFSWRSTLSSNLLNSSPRLNFAGIQFDLAFTLLTYAFAISNMAANVVTSLENYERERYASDAERKAKDDRLNFAITLLCRASGMFTHIADTILPELQKTGAYTNAPRVPDLSREVIGGLAKLTLADAQSLAIRKLLSRAISESTFSPGPPLPKSHPSPALIAKLYVEVSALYASSRTLIKTPGSSSSAPLSPSTDGKGMGEVSGEVRRYLSEEGALMSALAHKWLGVDAGESARSGEAVAYLLWAKEELEEVKTGKSKLSASLTGVMKDKKEKEREKGTKGSRKGRSVDELESVGSFLSMYKKENDSVHFKPVPSRSALQSSIPAGRLAVTPKPFSPPNPAFGPRNISPGVDVNRIASDLAGVNLAGSGDASDKALPSEQMGKYVGAGSYF